ncbi:hypothetical protein ACLB2K_010547 [Fragaria x ananassa]
MYLLIKDVTTIMPSCGVHDEFDPRSDLRIKLHHTNHFLNSSHSNTFINPIQSSASSLTNYTTQSLCYLYVLSKLKEHLQSKD